MADKSFGVKQLNIIESIESQNSTLNINATTVAISTNLTVAGVSTLGVSSFTGNVGFGSSALFGDDDKILLGDGNDLEIYHGTGDSGEGSYIDEVGTGKLYIKSNEISLKGIANNEPLASFTEDGPVELYYDNIKRLSTSGVGVTISGVTSTTNLYVTGISTFSGSVGIGTTNTSSVDSTNTKALAVGIVTSYDSFNTNIVSDNIKLGYHKDIELHDGDPALQLVGINSATSTLAIYRYQADGNSPTLDFVKSRNATPGSNSIVQTGDELGKITFNGDDGISISNAGAEIKAIVGTDAGSDLTDMPGSLVFLTSPDNENTPQEALRIDYNQDVGIGTAVPTNVVTNQEALLAVAGIVTAYQYYGSGEYLTGVSAGYWNKTDVGINTSDKVGIGTTNPLADLQVGTGITMHGNTGIISATEFHGNGENLSALPALTNSQSVITPNYDYQPPNTFTVKLRADWNTSWSHYSVYNSSDRNGNVVGNDPDININLGDTLVLDLSTNYEINDDPGNAPTWIKTQTGTGTGNSVTNPIATNNGDSSQIADITWTPNAAGTYYYQSEDHVNMVGQIIVTDNGVSNPPDDSFISAINVNSEGRVSGVVTFNGMVQATKSNRGIVQIHNDDNLSVAAGIVSISQSINLSGIVTIGDTLKVGTGVTVYGNTGIISATSFYGTATNLADGANITTGTINVARLGSGADGTKFLRGDNTWHVPDTSPNIGIRSDGVYVGTASTINFTTGNITVTDDVANVSVGSSVHYVGARVFFSTGTPAGTGTWYYVSSSNITTVNLDTNSFYNASNGRYEIPAGVTKVRLRANLYSDSGSGTPSNIWALYKNGSQITLGDGGFYSEVETAGYEDVAASPISDVISVSEGDYFQLVYKVNATTRSYGGTWQLEVVEGSLLGHYFASTNVTNADNITVQANNSADETVYPIFVDGATGTQGAESDTGFTYNPSSGDLTIGGELSATKLSGSISVGTGATVHSPSSNVITLGTNNTEKLRITSAGDVGIGTDDPVGSAATTNNTKVLAVGIVTAASYYGDGSNLKNLNILATGNFTGLIKEQVRIDVDRLDEDNDINLEEGMVHWFQDAENSASTPNIRYNGSTTLTSNMITGQVITVTIITQSDGSSGDAFSSGIEIDGVAITDVNWLCSTAPSSPAATSGYNVYTHTIIKKNNTGTINTDFLVISNVANYN